MVFRSLHEQTEGLWDTRGWAGLAPSPHACGAPQGSTTETGAPAAPSAHVLACRAHETTPGRKDKGVSRGGWLGSGGGLAEVTAKLARE